MDVHSVQEPNWVVLCALAALGGFFAYDFVRDHVRSSGPALILALVLHGVALTTLSSLDRIARPHVHDADDAVQLIDIEPPPPKVEEPPPPPEPEPEPPPPPPEPEPEPPKVAAKPKVKATTPQVVQETPEVPATAPSNAPLRFDLSNAVNGGQSGVSVQVGQQGGVAGGRDDKAKTKTQSASNVAAGPVQAGKPAWAPVSEVFVGKGPSQVNVPKIECAATAEQGLEGTVSLRVLVRRDGSVYQVKVNKGIGSGCDEIARQALMKARFKPATDTNGAPIDYEISAFEYEFRVRR